MDKKVIIHIGLPKTASTSFQLILGENRLRLRRQGFEYFLGRINLGYNHAELYLSVLRPDLFTFAHQRKSPILTPDLIEKTRERIKVFLGNSKLNNHVFSAEGLSFLRTEAELVRLKSMFPNDVIFKIIFVERDKNEWLESWKRQILSNPNRCLSTDPNSTMYVEPDTWLIEFEQLKKIWAAHFDDFICVHYRKEGLIEELLSEIGIDLPSRFMQVRYKDRIGGMTQKNLSSRAIRKFSRLINRFDYWIRYDRLIII